VSRPAVREHWFSGKTCSDVAYLGACYVFLCAVSQVSGVLPAIVMAPVAWLVFMDDVLNLPDDAWLRDRLAKDESRLTVEVDDPTNMNATDCTRPRRLEGYDEALLTTNGDCGPDINTVAAVLDRARTLFSENRMTATRKVNADGTFGEYVPQRYKEFLDQVEQCEAHLVRMRLKRVGLYAKNCNDYAVVMFAALHAGITVVPLYDSLGHDAVRYVVHHAELDTIFTSEENLELCLRLKSPPSFDTTNKEAACEKLKRVYVFKDLTLPEGSKNHANRGPRQVLGIDLKPFETLLEPLGAGASGSVQHGLVQPSDLAFILYTSGTTGTPKGVQLPHRSIIASASALCTSVVILESDIHLSYLPLAHAFEVAVIIAGVMRGASVGWYHGNVKELTDDAKVLRPTVFVGVPRVFQRVQQVILQQFALKPSLIRRLCYHTVRAQILNIRKTGRRLKVYDWLVFRQVKAALGGRVRLMCTGSAPLSPSIQEFIKVCFDLPCVVEGYGMTETSGVTHAMMGGMEGRFDDTVGHVGPPLACTEYKLQSVPDLAYTVDDKPCPRGEVLVRGPNIFSGYFKDEGKTAEIMTDGWLHTGDIGRINGNGTLSIIDRKKNIFKLSQGEYISPEHVESVILAVPEVGQVFVHGTSMLPHLVAIVVPDPLELIPRLKRGAVPSIGAADLPTLSPALDTWLPQFHALCTSPEHGKAIKAYILQQVSSACAAAGLARFMWPRDIMLESRLNQLLQGFSVENDCLTPTFKYRRNGIAARYKDELQNLLEAVPEKPAPATSYPPRSSRRN